MSRPIRVSPLLAVILTGAAVLAAGPSAGGPQAATAPVVEVRLSSYRFTPETIRLHHGQAVVLRLINEEGSHNFSAPALFAASSLDPASRGRVRRGAVELDGDGDWVDIRLTPQRAGTYPVRCTHLLHTMYGMKGQAVVD